MKFVRRSQWGARSPKYVNRRAMKARSTGHWNGPQVRVSGQTYWDHAKCASLVRGIQNFHMDGKGWADIAYNFVVCPHGYVFEGRGINVQNGANGTNNGNRTSHAIMWLSGQGNPFTPAEKTGWKDTYNYVRGSAGAASGALGHRDHKSTECPGNERYAWLKSGMPGGGSSPSTGGSSNAGTYPVLKRGSTGKFVAWVQQTIKTKAGGGISVDGVFGPNTESRVKDIQRMFNLTQDGIVGPNTWKVITFLNSIK